MPKRSSFIKSVIVSTPRIVDGPAIISPVPIERSYECGSLAIPTDDVLVDTPNSVPIDGIKLAFWGTRIILDIIWLITPLNFILAGWCIYALAKRYHLTLHSILLACSTPEICFAIYQQYLIYKTSRYLPTSVIAPEDRLRAQHDVFHADLRPTLTSTKSGNLVVTYATDDGDEGQKAPDESMIDIYQENCREYSCKERAVVHALPQTWQALAFRERFSIWFNHAPWETLCRDDILSWLAWMLMDLPLNKALQCQQNSKILQVAFATFENRSRMTFPRGNNSTVKVSRLTLDPLNAIGRPLFINLLNNGANWYIRNVTLRGLGMSHYIQGDMEYLIRIPQGWTPETGRTDPQAMPIMYLHELGFGLVQNLSVLKPLLTELPTHPILFPIAHHTAQSVFHGRHLKPWTRKGFISDIKAICDKWGFGWTEHAGGGLSVISHSNGSVHHGWLIKDCPGLIRRHTFVDPIIFCLDEGFTCHAFCYRKPITPFQLIIQRLVASEVGISSYIQRHFHWSDNCLYVEDYPELLDPSICQVYLGGKDVIVDAPRVRGYLESHGAILGDNLHWSENGGHGAALRGKGLVQVMRFASQGRGGQLDKHD